MYQHHFVPQKIQLRKDELCTLNDFQKLLGDISWLGPYLKITTGELKPLFDIFKGDSQPTSPWKLTEEARQALCKVDQAISQQQVSYLDYSKTWEAYILPTKHTPTAVLYQNGPLLWIHLPVSHAKVLTRYHEQVAIMIHMVRAESCQLIGQEPPCICQPYTKQQQD